MFILEDIEQNCIMFILEDIEQNCIMFILEDIETPVSFTRQLFQR
jgi:hypothetical protein